MSKRSKGAARRMMNQVKGAVSTIRQIDVDGFDLLIAAALVLIYYGFYGVTAYGAKLEYLVPGAIVLALATYAAYRE